MLSAISCSVLLSSVAELTDGLGASCCNLGGFWYARSSLHVTRAQSKGFDDANQATCSCFYCDRCSASRATVQYRDTCNDSAFPDAKSAEQCSLDILTELSESHIRNGR